MPADRREIRVHQSAAANPREVEEPPENVRHQQIPEPILVETTDKERLAGSRDHFIHLGKRGNPIEAGGMMTTPFPAAHPAPQGSL
jgi:hypothetical protein